MTLFGSDLPDGFIYGVGFLAHDEEAALLAAIAEVAFDTFQMRGIVARRRVKFYGRAYDDIPSAPMADFLMPLREKLAGWADVAPEAFAMALINEYPRGATIGWHRDAPQYDITAGVSLRSSCRMKLRPYIVPKDVAGVVRRAPRRTTHEIELVPRSAYLITGLARSGYEHSIPATEDLRYSITFRTLRS